MCHNLLMPFCNLYHLLLSFHHIDGVLVSMLTSSAIDRGLDP
jgi:hypothetical protein